MNTATEALPAQPSLSPPKTIKPSRTSVILMAFVFLAGVLLILSSWTLWPFQSKVMSTDNAYVRGQVTVMASQVSGYVTDVRVRDYSHVKAGDVILKIDDRVYQQQVAQAAAQLALAQADLDNSAQSQATSQADLGTRDADLDQAEAEYVRVTRDLARIEDLTSRGSVSERERDQVRALKQSAEANVKRARARIEMGKEAVTAASVSRGGLQAKVDAAQAQLSLAKINLSNTEIRAPRDGQVSEVSARLGQFVSSGSQITYLVPSQVWVAANFKETQAGKIAVGQKATILVDALNHAKLTGTVEDIAPAAGSEFSVLKADNATGNFTKVVQRISVRIKIDGNQAVARSLRPGMSVTAKVDTADAQSARKP